MSFEDIINRDKKNAEFIQQEFDNLSESEKAQKIVSDQEGALKMKDKVKRYVSPEDIVPGLNIDDLVKMNDIFRNKPTKNIGKAIEGKVGKDFETSFTGAVQRALNIDLRKNHGQKFNQIRNLFKDKPIIDLGAGGNIGGKKIAQMLEVSGYIAVEPHNHEGLEYAMIEGYGEEDKMFLKKREAKK